MGHYPCGGDETMVAKSKKDVKGWKPEKNFFLIPNELWDCPKSILPTNCKLVLIGTIRRAYGRRDVEVTHSGIARDAGLSRPTVRAAYKTLAELGLVEKLATKDGVVLQYRIHLERLADLPKLDTATWQNGDQGLAKLLPGAGKMETGGWQNGDQPTNKTEKTEDAKDKHVNDAHENDFFSWDDKDDIFGGDDGVRPMREQTTGTAETKRSLPIGFNNCDSALTFDEAGEREEAKMKVGLLWHNRLAATGAGDKLAIGKIHACRFGNYTTWAEVELHGQRIGEQLERMIYNQRVGMTEVSRFFAVCEEMREPGSPDLTLVEKELIATFPLKDPPRPQKLFFGRT
jgi:DNA-binding transcriptional ArsR family regulator